MIKITLKGNPISTQHAYLQRGKIRFMKKEAKELKDGYILQSRCQYKGKPLNDSLSVYIQIYFWDKRKRDIDNFHKLSLDALSWICYEDDSQIKVLTIQIMESDKSNPRIELIIEPIC